MIELSLDLPSVNLRGLAAVAFGVLALVWPNLTIAALVLLFGISALVDGVVHVTLPSGVGRRGRGGDVRGEATAVVLKDALPRRGPRDRVRRD